MAISPRSRPERGAVTVKSIEAEVGVQPRDLPWLEKVMQNQRLASSRLYRG